ncbi:isoaspartyl peptidase/L-asparaginase family protein [Carboxylicivirga linearis]|uniref:N(4)-(Beta-N-acetylglucosaminyl)-L-asparaginase n=1 Tax=Carboxylicivirga linearis TaxID=1628157 RepID=A0ABS5K247_9BACT|nr:N(4)-(beta-N-acetylglucosaminyl)-L-asparaginase [Carboxylicivirga linearis]MBS2100749.1 N(4)-(beta-N-acetylglucosaminyl)-L-asparaginase [Carboxylicivirga linearis]
MSGRRNFIKMALMGGAAVASQGLKARTLKATGFKGNSGSKPLVISTWNHGIPANAEAWKILSTGGKSIDAVEKGVMIPEGDPEVRSVGYGGYPDRDGHVTLDASIMDYNMDTGAVCFLEGIKHPINVARLVMDKTPHVMLSGEGALQFALEQGFKTENLLTEKSKKDWEEWKKKSDYKPVINIENHDTIGMLAIDEKGRVAGACTTSGASWKMHGRVGDSPIVGAGLFVDGEVGGATATGLGEAVIRTAGSAIVVELMRNGMSPFDACKEATHRIYKQHKGRPEFDYLQVGFIAINKHGEYGSYSLRKGFNYAVFDEKGGNRMEDAVYYYEE